MFLLPSGAARGAGPPAPWVFVHGLKGSTLLNAQGEAQWLTPMQALGLCNPKLALPLTWDAQEAQMTDGLLPGAPLGPIYVVPRLVGDDVYGPWLEALRHSGRAWVPFVYDWRRDNLASAAALEAFLQAQRGKTTVVAHSLGGLITLSVLNRRPELFEKVYFVGVPFAGGIGFLPDLTEGTRTGLNGRILAPAVVATFTSIYSFFPLDGTGVVDAAGKPLSADFYSAATWQRFGWGVYAGNAPAASATAYLQVALAHAKRFRESLAPSLQAYPPVRVIAGRGRPTLHEVQVSGANRPDFTVRPKVSGDGRVAENDALPPQGVPFTVDYAAAEHSALLNDPQVINLLLGGSSAP